MELTLTVPTHPGDAPVHVKYPAGVIRYEQRPAQRSTWEFADDEDDEDENELLIVDVRMMEGSMAEMLAGIPGALEWDDKKLRKARKLMYRAWEEPNPANASRSRTQPSPPRRTAPTPTCCWPKKQPTPWPARSSITGRESKRVNARSSTCILPVCIITRTISPRPNPGLLPRCADSFPPNDSHPRSG